MKITILGLALLAQTSLASHPRYASAVNPTAEGAPAPEFPAAAWRAGQALAKRAFTPLPTGAVTPKG